MLVARMLSATATLTSHQSAHMWCRSNGEPQVAAAQARVQRLHDAAHAILKRIAVSKALAAAADGGGGGHAGREAVLAWLSAACYACEPRTDGGEKAVLNKEYVNRGAADGFALGVSAVALAFVAPVLDKFEKAPGDVLARVDATQAAPLRFRLGSLLEGRRLAAPPAVAAEIAAGAGAADDGHAAMDVDGEDDADVATGAPEGDAAQWLAAAPAFGDADAPSANFMTECYFLACRAMQVSSSF